jgi:hypothetical protein
VVAVVRAVKRLEDPLEVFPRNARSVIRDPEQNVRAVGAAANRDRVVSGEIRGVLEHVRERALDLRRVDAEQRDVGVEVELEGARRSCCGGDGDQLVQRRPVSAWLRAAGLEPGEVKQIADEPPSLR